MHRLTKIARSTPQLARAASRPTVLPLSLSLRSPLLTPAAAFSSTPLRFNTAPGGIPPQSELPKGAEVVVPKVCPLQPNLRTFKH